MAERRRINARLELSSKESGGEKRYQRHCGAECEGKWQREVVLKPVWS